MVVKTASCLRVTVASVKFAEPEVTVSDGSSHLPLTFSLPPGPDAASKVIDLAVTLPEASVNLSSRVNFRAT